jgi:RimJ/RimL family protein N-acetyltransferase
VPDRVRIEGDRVTLRPLRMDEFESTYAARLEEDPTAQPIVPERDALLARFERSGIMQDGALDLAIEVEGRKIGEIQTYLPPGRELPVGAFEVGIGIDDPSLRGRG